MDDAVQHAVACAGRIFYRPERVVTALLETFAALDEREYPGDDGVARHAYGQPVRLAATRAVFGLRPLHWPMLNLLDPAERDRRAYADAAAAAVAAARRRANR